MNIKVKANVVGHTPEEIRNCNQIIASAKLAGIDWKNYTTVHHHPLLCVEVFYKMMFEDLDEYDYGTIEHDIAQTLEDMYTLSNEFEEYDSESFFMGDFEELCGMFEECEYLVNKYEWMLNLK